MGITQVFILCLASAFIFETTLAAIHNPSPVSFNAFRIKNAKNPNLCLQLSTSTCDGDASHAVTLKTCSLTTPNYLQEFKLSEESVCGTWHIQLRRNPAIELKYVSDTVLGSQLWDETTLDSERKKFIWTISETSAGSRKWIISVKIGSSSTTKYLTRDPICVVEESLQFDSGSPVNDYNYWVLDETITCG